MDDSERRDLERLQESVRASKETQARSQELLDSPVRLLARARKILDDALAVGDKVRAGNARAIIQELQAGQASLKRAHRESVAAEAVGMEEIRRFQAEG